MNVPLKMYCHNMCGRRFEPSVLQNLWSTDMIPLKYRDFLYVLPQQSLPIKVKQWTIDLR